MDDKEKDKKRQEIAIEKANLLGRFPANVIHDGSKEVIENMPTNKQNRNIKKEYNKSQNVYRQYPPTQKWEAYNDSGSTSRYFYCAKASKKDRDEGLDEFEENQTTDGNIRSNQETARMFETNSVLRKNIHPTVKPTELMQYLIRLVTPKEGIILDPFMGSGSTGKAVMFENRERKSNYKFIGIEKEKQYCEIAKARIEWVKILYYKE